jgi:tight adherence protein B
MMTMLALGVGLLALSGSAIVLYAFMERHDRQVYGWRVSLAVRGDKKARARAEHRVAQSSPWLERSTILRLWLRALGLHRAWGLRTPLAALIVIGMTAAGTGWTVSALMLHLPAAISAALAILTFVLVPRVFLGWEQGRTESRFVAQFPDAIDMLVRMVRAGLPVAAAMRTVGHEAPRPISAAFNGIADQIEIGVPVEEALATVAGRIGLADFRFFAVAIALQRTTGGSLAATLETLADIIRKRRMIRLKAQAVTSEVRVSALILGALPFLVAGALTIAAPQYLAPLIYDARGNVILGAAILNIFLAAIMMRAIVRRGIGV